jgi:hypothetical protein
MIKRAKKKKAPPKWADHAKKFREALDRLGLTVASQRTEQALGISIRQSQRLAVGEQPVPPPLDRLLKMYIKHGLPDEYLPDET